jgi:hypothetical protein
MFKIAAVVSSMLILILIMSYTNDTVYVDENNTVIQVNDKKLTYPRPLNKYDLECKIVYINTNTNTK